MPNQSAEKKGILYETKVPIAPDGGWGWMVCLSSFLTFVILDGTMFTYGVFYVVLLDYFDEGKGPTAMVGSINFGMSMFFGPFASIMINLWGLRTVAICGTILVSFSFACSTFAPSISVLSFLYGFLGGTGISMVYVPSVVVVGFYFDKRRALANGITSSGSGLGAFLFSPMFNYFIDIYTWKGAMLLLSGITLHCIVLSSVYRPLKFKVHTHSNDAPIISDKIDKDQENDHLGGSTEVYNCNLGSDIKSNSDERVNYFIEGAKASSLTDVNSLEKTDLLKSLQLKRQMDKHRSPVTLSNHLAKQSTTESSTYENLLTCIKQDVTTPLSHSSGNVSSLTSHRRVNNLHMNQITLKPLEKRDIFYSGSLHRLPDYLDSPAIGIDAQNMSPKMAVACCKVSNFRNTIMKITGIHLLKNHVFLFIVAYSVLWTAHSTILTILPHYCLNEGHSNMKAASLLSYIGAANILARILAGWISNFEQVDCMLVNIAALFLGGITCLLIPFTHKYVFLCIEASLFGIGMATWTSLRPIVLVELLGISNLTSAFGLLAMFQGLAFIVGPPIAGMLYDMSGSYQIPFLIAGAAFITSGSICILMKLMFTSEKRNCCLVKTNTH